MMAFLSRNKHDQCTNEYQFEHKSSKNKISKIKVSYIIFIPTYIYTWKTTDRLVMSIVHSNQANEEARKPHSYSNLIRTYKSWNENSYNKKSRAQF